MPGQTLFTFTYVMVFKESSENADASCSSRLQLHAEDGVVCEREETVYALRLKTKLISSKYNAFETFKDPLLFKA